MIVHLLNGVLLQFPPNLVSQVGVYGPLRILFAKQSSLRTVADPLQALIDVE